MTDKMESAADPILNPSVNIVHKVYGQNGDTEMATEMAVFKTATNPNNTYSSSEAYIIDCRLYTYMACNC